MRKYLMLTLIPLFFGCASQKAENLDASLVTDNCACAYEPDASREIKHPRIVEEVAVKQKKRSCDDHQVMDCGCGQCDAFHVTHPAFSEQMEYQSETQQNMPQVVTYVPAQPQAYTLLAGRVFNRFIKDTYAIYKDNPNLKLYVQKPDLKASDLPEGYEKGIDLFKMQLQNAHAFQLTDNENEADYVLSTTIDWFDTPSKDVPAIKYIVDLTSKDKTSAGSWSNIVKKADNKSWL